MHEDYYKQIFSQNLRYYMELKGKTQIDIINDLGVNKSAISTWCNGTRLPRMDKVDLLAKYFHINRSDLIEEHSSREIPLPDYTNTATPAEFENIIKKYRALDEQGKHTINIMLDNETARVEKYGKLTERYDNPIIAPMRLISYYYKNASAGTGQLIIDNLPEKDIEIPDIPEYKNVSYAIGVNGSSMEPAYSDGDILLVETTREIRIGDIGIFQIDDQCYVKKLGENELISINEDYDNIPLNESARTMGKVIGKL